ncbi:unnamed protein product [Nezara viridula]|uniref:Uncharacterized protein n=1 Tax=Nezara viridula TaxID=85310 RepID=A0A9P0HJQ6_NEZVI|nr:unnamed protein product [Nezara viridula]
MHCLGGLRADAPPDGSAKRGLPTKETRKRSAPVAQCPGTPWDMSYPPGHVVTCHRCGGYKVRPQVPTYSQSILGAMEIQTCACVVLSSTFTLSVLS